MIERDKSIPQNPIVIDVHDLKEVQRWMRHFNISKEELFRAVEEYGPNVDAISFGLKVRSARDSMH